MHFDDRLATVLRARAQGPALARIQFRQLLDLLGTQGSHQRSDTLEAAYDRLAELSRVLPAADRAAMLRDGSTRLRSPRLVATLAGGEPVQAEAAIDAAGLDPAQWVDLLPALSPAARARLGARGDLVPALRERMGRLGVIRPALPAAASDEVVITPEAVAAEPAPESIGALVRKIEAYRRSREVIEGVPGAEAPRLPLGEDHVLQVPAKARAFDFATDPSGSIVWADPGVASMVVGQRLAGAPEPEALAARLRGRQPLRGQRLILSGSPLIAGDWRVDANPRFDPLSGSFLGHHGRMRRWPVAAVMPVPVGNDSPADRVRQLLHELRTPVNAIQGFAEVIQQQLFGPTPHEYRALAAGIAGDAARMLAAFEELERLAKLESAAIALEPGETDMAAAISATVGQLAAHTGQRDSGFILPDALPPCPVHLAQIEVDRIVWRLLATLAGTAAPGERLALGLERDAEVIHLTLTLPASLAGRADDDLFHAGPGAVPQVIAAGVFGVGFALRLARAELAASGGALERNEGKLIARLPALTVAAQDHSQTG